MKKKKETAYSFRFKRFARKSYAVFNSLGKKVSIGVLTSAVLTSVPLAKTAANESGEASNMTRHALDEVEVTASRVPIELNEAAKIVAVITKLEIEAAPVKSIQDLLEYVAGIDVRQRGKQGVQADISIHGGTHDQTAIFLNGINFSNPQTGHYNFDIPVNLSDIERIEIIEGPAAKIYGNGAFTGAINIITRVGSEKEIYIGAGAGMHQLITTEAGISLPTGNISHKLSGSYNASDGYTDNSDYDMYTLFWQSRYDSPDADIQFQTGYNRKSYGANTFYSAAYPEQHDQTSRIFASIQAKSKGKIQFTPQLFWNQHNDHYQLTKGSSSGENFHKTQVFGGKFDANFNWKLGRTVFGGEVLNEGILSTVLGNPLKEPVAVSGEKDIFYTCKDNRTNISYFLEHNIGWRKWSASLGILANYNTALNDDFQFYPGVDIAFRLSPQLKFYASFNTAFRMPTFTDLYYEGKTNKGNPDLKPEKSTAYEVGAKFKNNFLNTYISGYYRKGKNMIDWVKKNPEDIWESKNLTSLDTYGFETSVSFFPGQLIGDNCFINSFTIGYSYIFQDKKEMEYISNYALDYLKHKFVCSLNHRVYKAISMQWNFRWQDRVGSYTKYESLKPAYEESYTPYNVLDVKINWKLKNWKIYLEASNVFDAYYFDMGNIPQPGYWISGGVKYAFKY